MSCQFLPKQYHGALTDLLRPDLPSSRPQEHDDEPNIVTLAPCLVPRRVLADSRATGILVSSSVSWERRREKRAWPITISKWRKVTLQN